MDKANGVHTHLVVNIMIVGIIPESHVDGMPREIVSTVVIDGLVCCKAEEKDCLTLAHAGDGVGEPSA